MRKAEILDNHSRPPRAFESETAASTVQGAVRAEFSAANSAMCDRQSAVRGGRCALCLCPERGSWGVGERAESLRAETALGGLSLLSLYHLLYTRCVEIAVSADFRAPRSAAHF